MKKGILALKVFSVHLNSKFLLMLNWIFFLTVFACLNVSATGFSQNVKLSVDIQNTELKKALSILEKKAGTRFLYSEKLFPAGKLVSLQEKDAWLFDLLTKALENTGLTYRVINESLIAITLQSATIEDIRVTGKVIDNTGQALPGVSVKVVGANTGTVTDANGQYTITVPEGASLLFTYIGYADQTIAVGSRTTLNVTMAESADTKLNEVVVIGYGTQRKRDLTGSVASISARDLQNIPIARADQMIQGRASGVQVTQTNAQPGGNTSIRIRGTNSITSGNEPLFVIDGYPGAGDLNSINPNDIQSIEILKDASATAIYGTRGANGVVLITTKKGTAGQSAINFEVYTGAQTVRNPYELMNAREFATYLNDVQRLNNAESTAAPKALPFTDAQIAALGEGTNWQDELFRTAPISNYQLSFLGGTNDTRYNLSLNYFDNQGVIINSGFQRGSIRLNLDRKIGDKINIGFTSQISRSFDKRALVNTSGGSAGGVVGDALKMNPGVPVYNSDGTYSFENGPGTAVTNLGNPVAYANKTQNQYNSLRGLINIFGEYEFIKGLKFKAFAGTDFNNVNRDFYIPSDIFLGSKVGRLSRENSNDFSWVSENTLTFDRQFNKIHALNLVTGASFQQFQNSNFASSAEGFFTNGLETSGLGIGSNIQTPSSGRGKINLASFYGRANYRLLDKYLFTFTLRADGSSKFGAETKWGYFPSAAFAWRITDEKFMQNFNQISDLKLRTSFGVTGNQEIVPYSTGVRYNPVGYTYGASRVVGAAIANIPNEELSWESTTSFDLGLDLGLFSNKVSITADYYQKRTSDLLLDVSLPRSTGIASVLMNAGSTQNRGFELGVSTENINAKSFKWRTSANISTNRNKVLDLNGEYERFVGEASSSLFPSSSSGTSILRVGEPMGSFFGYKFDGIWQTQAEIDASGITFGTKPRPGDPRYADTNNDKILDAKDRVIIGQAQPDFIYGLTNDFTFGRFNLNLFIQGVQGADILNLNRYELESGDVTSNKLDAVNNRWTGPGTSNTIAKANSTLRRVMGITSEVVEDGSYIRLKTISLAYNIPMPKSLVKTFKSANVYVTGTNLFTRTNYTGYDPEVNSFRDNSATLAQGSTTRAAVSNNLGINTDYNAYPTAKMFIAGVKFGF
jgi:TonB-dependent starch-binding outer membrane protein SusC